MSAGGRKPGNKHPMELPSQSVTFDPEAFNEFINTQGVRLVHWKALRCPVGMTDVDDNRRPLHDHSGCSNGFIYYKAGIVTAGMQGNGNTQVGNDLGLIENSYLTVSFPQFYDGTETPVTMAPFDRFYLDESEPGARINVPTWHLQTAHQSRIDKLYYPAVSVEYLMDSRGQSYTEGDDFCIQNGEIKWHKDRWPGYQTEVGRGTIYAIRYHYRPFWYVTKLLHEIRVAQVETFNGRMLVRMPQQALLAREYTFTNEQADSLAKDSNSLRQTPSPDDGSWGAPR